VTWVRAVAGQVDGHTDEVEGRVDRHGVGLPVTAARGGRQVDIRLLQVGARHVVDGHRVGASERRQVQPLHAVHVHADRGHVAHEQRPLADGRQAHLLVDAGTVEVERVRT